MKINKYLLSAIILNLNLIAITNINAMDPNQSIDVTANHPSMQKKLNQKLEEFAKEGNLEGVKRLLLAGANVNKTKALYKAVKSTRDDVVRALLNAGANVNHYQDIDNFVQYAALGGYIELLQMLLSLGTADPEYSDNGESAISWAIGENNNEQTAYQIIKLLLNAGFDKVNLIGIDDEMPLEISNEEYGPNSTVSQLLRAHGALTESEMPQPMETEE